MTSTEHSRAGFVLAGGKSSRMGKNIDKAFLDFAGQTLLDRAIGVMRMVCDKVTVVGDPAKFAKHCESVVADIFPGCGPLAGIHTALVHSSAELNFMLAVDMPFVSTELLAFLFKAADNNAVITVPRIAKGFQPLCAIYRPSFSGIAETALRAGNYKIGAAFANVPIHVIEEDELTEAGFSENNFFNINTLEDRSSANQ
jgi:molybdopterin-guanine dinucleotide biosynthesis protein A